MPNDNFSGGFDRATRAQGYLLWVKNLFVSVIITCTNRTVA